MTGFDDELRGALHDDAWALPAPADPQGWVRARVRRRRARALVAGAAAVGLLATGAVAVVGVGGESDADTLSLGGGTAGEEVGFTYEPREVQFGEQVAVRLDAAGELLVRGTDSKNCRTLPVSVARYPGGDLRIRYDPAPAGCQPVGESLVIRLADQAVVNGTVVYQDDDTQGVLLRPEAGDPPAQSPDPEDCGVFGRPGKDEPPRDPTRIDCLLSAASAGRPAVLDYWETGSFVGRRSLVEVVGTSRVRVTTEFFTDSNPGPRTWFVTECAQVARVGGLLRWRECTAPGAPALPPSPQDCGSFAMSASGDGVPLKALTCLNDALGQGLPARLVLTGSDKPRVTYESIGPSWLRIIDGAGTWECAGLEIFLEGRLEPRLCDG